MLTSMTLMLGLVAIGEAPERKDAPMPGDVKILGRSNWKAPAVKVGDPAQQFVIRDDEEMAKRLPANEKLSTTIENLNKSTKIDLDWKKHMLIVVTGGVQRSGGYRIEITNVKKNDDTMTVRWKMHSPKPGDLVTAALTHPAQAIIVERFDGKVVFDPPLK